MKRKEVAELVNRIVEETVNSLPPEIREEFNVWICPLEQRKYFSIYDQKIEEIQKHGIRGKPDTFLEASCMCNALLKEKNVGFDIIKLEEALRKRKEDKTLRRLAFINYEIALKVVLSMIEEVTVYEEIERDQWVELQRTRSRKVKLPKGVIPNSPLETRIIHDFAYMDIGEKSDLNVMLFSDMLHLLFLF